MDAATFARATEAEASTAATISGSEDAEISKAHENDSTTWIIAEINNVPCLVPVSQSQTDTQILSLESTAMVSSSGKLCSASETSGCPAPRKGYVFTFHSPDQPKPSDNKPILLGRALCERLQAMQPNQTESLIMALKQGHHSITTAISEASAGITENLPSPISADTAQPETVVDDTPTPTPAESLANLTERLNAVLTRNPEESLSSLKQSVREVIGENELTFPLVTANVPILESTAIPASSNNLHSATSLDIVHFTPVISSENCVTDKQTLGIAQGKPKTVPMVFVDDCDRTTAKTATGKKRALENENPDVTDPVSLSKKPKMDNHTNIRFLCRDPGRSSEKLRAMAAEVKLLKKRLQRRQKRLELNNDEIKTLNGKLVTAQNAHQEEVSKLPDLLQELIKNSKQRKRGRRFSDKMMDLCAKVYSRSPKAYIALIEESDLPFPSAMAVRHVIQHDTATALPGAGLYAPAKRGPVDQLKPEQREELLRLFSINHYPTNEEKKEIGTRLDIPTKKVARWFSNRIIKENRDKAVEQWCDEVRSAP